VCKRLGAWAGSLFSVKWISMEICVDDAKVVELQYETGACFPTIFDFVQNE
jgi:hypothetical protein